jgi:hypothetical protein
VQKLTRHIGYDEIFSEKTKFETQGSPVEVALKCPEIAVPSSNYEFVDCRIDARERNLLDVGVYSWCSPPEARWPALLFWNSS